MELYDWLLLLHVAGAFALVATLVLYGAVFAGAPAQLSGPLTAFGGILFAVGGALTLIFGIWLAIDVDGYELWDGWILAAIILWLATAEVGRRVGRAVAADGEATEAGATGRARTLYWLLAAITLVFLLLMIFKPGA